MVWMLPGKFGDIFALLPGLKRIATLNGAPVQVATTEKYKGIFERVAYVKAVVMPGLAFEQIQEGYHWCCQRWRVVRVGHWGIHPNPKQKNWERDICGMADLPYRCGPLEFDKRNKEEEARYLQGLPPHSGVAFNLEGQSSAFNDTLRLREILEDLGALNLSLHRPSNIVDLVGLYERLRVLITVDTSTLHLSRAVPGLKVIQMTRKDGYAATDSVEGEVLRVWYSEVDRQWSRIRRILSCRS